MQKLNKDLASYLLEFIDFNRYGKFMDILYPGCFIQFYNKHVKITIERYCTEYRLFGKLHSCHNQPAIIWSNGSKEWYKNDKLHRDCDQPATISIFGVKEWYWNGRFHRDNNQPARTCMSRGEYWKNGIQYYL